MSNVTALNSKRKGAPKAQTFNIEFVEVEGIQLRFGVKPGAAEHTPLLVFNGIGANLELVENFAEAMSDITVITLDMPGTGKSENMPLPRRLPGVVKLVRKGLDKLGYTGQIDVAGVSWGSAAAQEFAHKYPNRCRRLVLGSASPGFAMFPAKLSVMTKRLTPMRYFSNGYMLKVAPEIYGGIIRQRPIMMRHFMNKIRPPTVRGYFYQLLSSSGWSSLPWLHRLNMPALIMHGDDDPIVPLVNAKLMHWLMPRSRLHIVRNGGHLFFVMRAYEAASIVRNFLTEKDAQAKATKHHPDTPPNTNRTHSQKP